MKNLSRMFAIALLGTLATFATADEMKSSGDGMKDDAMMKDDMAKEMSDPGMEKDDMSKDMGHGMKEDDMAKDAMKNEGMDDMKKDGMSMKDSAMDDKDKM